MAEEKNFENKVKEFITLLGIYPANYPKNKMTVPPTGWFFKHWAGAYSPKGIPDIIASVKGQFVGIEVKASKGKPSILQVRNINSINETGGYGVILYPKDFEQFKEEILKILKEC